MAATTKTGRRGVVALLAFVWAKLKRRNTRTAKTPRRHREGAAAADRERFAALDAAGTRFKARKEIVRLLDARSVSTRAAWTRGHTCDGCHHKNLAPWRRGAPGVCLGELEEEKRQDRQRQLLSRMLTSNACAPHLSSLLAREP